MKFGKVRIEEGEFLFTRHMVLNSLPCQDILWAYKKQEPMFPSVGRQMLLNFLVIVTKRKKVYQFDMTQKEADDCIMLLKLLTPEMTVGFPNGERIPLQSCSNTRDLGAMLTMSKRYIIPRKLLRSGDLYHLSLADQKVLREDYQVKKVIDLRSREERRERPDTILAGVEYYHLPILDEEVAGVVQLRNLKHVLEGDTINTPEKFEEMYGALVTDQYTQGQLARLMDLLLEHSGGAVLWHGGVGKDRTGIVTMLVLSALGISRKIIRQDYLRSNEYLEGSCKYMKRYLTATGAFDEAAEERLKSMFHVEENSLNRAFYCIDRNYVSMQSFLKKQLLLSPKVLEELREKYLL